MRPPCYGCMFAELLKIALCTVVTQPFILGSGIQNKCPCLLHEKRYSPGNGEFKLAPGLCCPKYVLGESGVLKDALALL